LSFPNWDRQTKSQQAAVGRSSSLPSHQLVIRVPLSLSLPSSTRRRLPSHRIASPFFHPAAMTLIRSAVLLASVAIGVQAQYNDSSRYMTPDAYWHNR
jgi:hypothetical protein